MDPALLIRGFVLGFTIAAAVGPISLLCIKRTLAEGRTVGFVSGLGVATADATYGAIAAFGLTAITDQLVAFRQPLAIVGGLFLLWIAWRTVTSVPGEAAADPSTRRPRPSRAGRRLPVDPRAHDDQPDDDPVVRGTVRRPRGHGRRRRRRDRADARRVPWQRAWWVVLVSVVGALRSRITPTWLRRVNVGSGLLIGAFGLIAIWSGFAMA